MKKKAMNTDLKRRRFLVAAGTVVGGAGIAAALIPFVSSMSPSARAFSAGAPVEVNGSKLEPGQQITVEWRSKPVWILQRTEQILQDLQSEQLLEKLRDPNSMVTSQQPEYAHNNYRARKEEFLVAVGICTHLGCIPTFRPDRAPEDLGPDWVGGYFCPCHGSLYDLAGRVFKNVPAPTNLVIPPYYFLSDNKILIGEDSRNDSIS